MILFLIFQKITKAKVAKLNNFKMNLNLTSNKNRSMLHSPHNKEKITFDLLRLFIGYTGREAVCCGVRGRALASLTDVRGFEPQRGDRLEYVLGLTRFRVFLPNYIYIL